MSMTTELLFRDDAYATTAEARIMTVTETGGLVVDRSVFYPTGGGQPGDAGTLTRQDGRTIAVATTVWADPGKTLIALVPTEGQPTPEVGESVRMELDWARRLARMRVHTALHLLSVALPYPVTGGSIGDGEGWLDFDMPDGADREAITADLQRMIDTDAAVTDRWITDEELDVNPGLVKTMRVKPPRGSGRVRLVEIAGLDLQPCGGTHVRRTGEIGRVTITGIEKKGKQNRRVRLAVL